eukprot:gene6546-13242_t
MQALTKAVQKFLNIYSSQLMPKTFGGSISAHRATLNSSMSKDVSFTFMIPDYLCRKNEEQSIISVAAILALFDEFSSQSFMALDQYHRPGVSLSLTARILKSCPAGSKVQFISTPRKLGNIIGFCDMTMLSEEGEVLATGTHTKYLPMGWFWNLFIGNSFAFALRMALPNLAPPNESTISQAFLGGARKGSIFDIFQLQPIDSSSSSSSSSSGVIGGHSFKVTGAEMCNYLGSLHGGAVAMVAEEAARLQCSAQSLSLVLSNGPWTVPASVSVSVFATPQGNWCVEAGLPLPSPWLGLNV